MVEELEGWTVYDNPTDFPGKFVARNWVGETPTDTVLIDTTLDGLRAQLPQGLGCLVRDPRDHPHIIEVWI